MYIRNITISNSTNNTSMGFIFDGSAIYPLSSFDDKQSANNWVNNGYNQHGSTYIKTTMNERHMTLKFYINYNNAGQRAGVYDTYGNMMRCLNPTDGLLLLTIHSVAGGGIATAENSISRSIDVYVAEPPALVSQHGGLMEYSVELVAPYPFWRDLYGHYKDFTNAVGGFTFQTQFDEQNGKIFGQDGHIAYINNQGDVPSPITVEIRNASMTNPSIMLADGSFIGITGGIGTNDNVQITTAYGNKNILINGIYRNALLTVGSQWIQLPVGVTQVSAFTGSGSPNIRIYYNNYYNSYTR